MQETVREQAATIARTKRLVLSNQKETSMHYKNGREAKQGDKVVAMSNGSVAVGMLHSLQPGASTCNGRLAATNQNDAYVTVGDCLHVDDVQALLKNHEAAAEAKPVKAYD